MAPNHALASIGGGLSSAVGGLIAQGGSETVATAGLAAGIIGVISAVLGGLYPWYKVWIESKRQGERIAEQEDWIRKARVRLHAYADEIGASKSRIALLEGKLGLTESAIKVNSANIQAVADAVVPAVHLEPPVDVERLRLPLDLADLDDEP